MLTPAQLTEIGETIYGPRWKARFARQLQIAGVTLHRWLTNPLLPMPEARLPAIRKLLGVAVDDTDANIAVLQARRARLMALADAAWPQQWQTTAPAGPEAAADAPAAANADQDEDTR